jgi:glycosyltransferase involved in cell wall biosynthesis
MTIERITLPRVSVIMPIRNEERFIARSLGAVLEQEYPAELLEVLLVDGMSTDETRTVAHRIAAEQSSDHHMPVTLLDNPAQHVSAAFNRGLREARGEIVIIVGGHCEIAPDYVRRCVETLERTGAACVGGPMQTIGETGVARTIALAQSTPFGVGGVAFRIGRAQPGYVDTVAFGAYRREVFDRIGGFDEELVRNQDDEFNFRLTQSGGKIWLDPTIGSRYYSRASLRGLWRQYYQYGFYKVLVIQKRGAVPSWRHLVPGAFVLALLASLLLGFVTRRPLLAASVAGSYAAANLVASALTAREDPRALPLLPAAFATMHLAYGLGFLMGVWRWRKLSSSTAR